MDYLKQLWRGELPLFVVFWFYGLMGLFLFNELFSLVVLLSLSQSAELGKWVSVISNSITILYQCFISIAVIRSSLAFQGLILWRFLAWGAVAGGCYYMGLKVWGMYLLFAG